MIVYDITDRESFDNVKTWMTEIEKYLKNKKSFFIRKLKIKICIIERKSYVSWE